MNLKWDIRNAERFVFTLFQYVYIDRVLGTQYNRLCQPEIIKINETKILLS